MLPLPAAAVLPSRRRRSSRWAVAARASAFTAEQGRNPLRDLGIDLVLVRGQGAGSGLFRGVILHLCGCPERHLLDRVDTDARNLVQGVYEAVYDVDRPVDHVLKDRQDAGLHITHKVLNVHAGRVEGQLKSVPQVHNEVDAGHESDLHPVPGGQNRVDADQPGDFQATDGLDPLINRGHHDADRKGDPEQGVRQKCREERLGGSVGDPCRGRLIPRATA